MGNTNIKSGKTEKLKYKKSIFDLENIKSVYI